MELWDIYDIDRVRTGRVAQRGKPASEGGLGEGEYHLVVHICVFNGRGQLLLQQRQKDKEGYPNLWDVSAAGSALAGENSAAAASRELREELGLVHDFTKERPFLTTHFERGFDDWYFIRMEADISDLRLQPEEEVPAQLGLYEDDAQAQRETSLLKTSIGLHKRFGRNSLFRGIDLMEAGTTRERNEQIGGHRK